MKRTVSALLCAVIILASSAVYSTINFIEDYDAIEAASDSVLYLETDDDYDDDDMRTGSGFIAFDNQTFITNYHVVEGAIRIMAYDEDYNEYKVGKILAVDKDRDIAIISLKAPTHLIPLALAYKPTLKRGQPVAAIGYPKGLFNTFSTGNISAIVELEKKRIVQFTAPVSHGSSGGALFNNNGEVIGITSSIVEDGQNINFAVDITHAIELYRQYNPEYLAGTATKASTLKPTATLKPTNTPTKAPQSKPKLATPTISTTSIKGDSIILSWKAVPGATKYNVYRSAKIDGTYIFVGSTADTRFESRLHSYGLTYYFKLSCSDNSSNISEKSKPIMVIMPEKTPQPTRKPTPIPSPSPSPAPIRNISVGCKMNCRRRTKRGSFLA